MSADSYRAIAESLSFETRPFIGGKFVAASSGRSFTTFNPATGRPIAEIGEGVAADIDAAVAAAREAFENGPWPRMAPRERKRILLKLADLIERDQRALAVMESLDNGKPAVDAETADLPDAIATLRWHAEAADKIYDQVSPTSRDIVSMVVREPIGVVGAVIPWNFPLAITAMKIGPALAGGNTLVIKPAELTSLTALRLAALAAEAGLPEGVLNIVPGFGETAGQALGRHPDVDCLSFTGSTPVGRMFLRYAAESNLKRVLLELGGKSPAIVMDDVTDLDAAVEQIAIGILFSQGENCSAGSRLLVQRGVRDRLMEALLAHFKTWTVGDPLDPSTRIGAMVSARHLDRVMGYVEAGQAEGARLLTGGTRLFPKSGGSFIGPTIFDGVSNRMRIAQEEIFGPVLSVIDFDSEEDAIRIANDTHYGLAASLYTNDLHRAHRISRAIRAGTVSVNCFSEGDQAVPFGGYKQSGFGGREKSFQAHDQYLQTKTVWMQMKSVA